LVAWLSLFEIAVAIIGEAERNLGAPIEWTIGGGTMLRRMYNHRESKDIDVFISDAQYLTSFSPRLNDIAAQYVNGRTDLYVEQSNYVKLIVGEGEIDFIVAPHLMSPFAKREMIGAVSVMVETAAEILAKKVFYRAADFTARDMFDLAFLIENGVADEMVDSDASMYLPKLEVIVRRMDMNMQSLSISFAAIDANDYDPDFDDCVATIRRFTFRHRSQSEGHA
jgi:hypothetical protein